MGQEEWNRYYELQKLADNVWITEGETAFQRKCQDDADAAFEEYEYAAGLKSWEYSWK